MNAKQESGMDTYKSPDWQTGLPEQGRKIRVLFPDGRLFTEFYGTYLFVEDKFMLPFFVAYGDDDRPSIVEWAYEYDGCPWTNVKDGLPDPGREVVIRGWEHVCGSMFRVVERTGTAVVGIRDAVKFRVIPLPDNAQWVYDQGPRGVKFATISNDGDEIPTPSKLVMKPKRWFGGLF